MIKYCQSVKDAIRFLEDVERSLMTISILL